MIPTAVEGGKPEPWLPAPPEPPPVRVDAEAVSSRPRLVTRPLALVLVASFGAMTSFYLLLSVVPLYASSAGAGGVGAGGGPRGAGLSPGGARVAPPRPRGGGGGPPGVGLPGQVGSPPVFVAAAIAALAGLVVVPGLPGREPAPDRPVGVLSGLRTPALARPALVFSATALAAGIVVAFLPLAVAGASGSLMVSALWTLSSDGARGRGPGGFGCGAAQTGSPGALGLPAAMMLGVLA